MISSQRAVKAEPQGVIFDLDGTLFKTEEITVSAIKEAAHQHGVELREASIHSMIGNTWRGIQSIVQQACGERVSAEEVMRLCDQIIEQTISEKGVEPKEGLDQLLEFLEGIDLPRAIATAGDSDWAEMILGEYAKRFSTIVTADEVDNPKPDPEQLILAATELKVPPANCVVVGDCSIDVEAAESSGMISILIPGISVSTAAVREKAHLVADSLRDVKDWFSSCLKR